MPNLLTDIGEEWVVENNVDGATVIATLYSDATDAITDSDDLSTITTEPTGASYARQSSTVTTKQIGSDFGFDNDSLIEFDVSDSTVTVDHVAYIVNFQSDSVAGDGSAVDNLIGVVPLSQSRDLSQFDVLEFAAGDLELTLD